MSAAVRLGQAVALEDGEADPAVEVAEAVAERGAAGDGVDAAAAERLAQLAVDELVENGVLGPQAQRHPAAVECAGPGDRGVGGALEDRAATVGGGPLRGGVEDLLEHAGDGQDERRPELAEVGDQVLDVGAVGPSRARLLTAPTWMIRAKTWASGRNSSVEASSVSNSSESSSTATPSSN